MAGVTLVELMVGLVIGLIVILGVFSLYLATVRGGADTMQGVRLNQDLRSAMIVMTSDLRRAGYWNQDQSASNPFSLQHTLGFRVPDSSCVRFEYDRNQDGFIDFEAESFGFRFADGRIGMLAEPDPTEVLGRFNECSQEVGTWVELAGDDDLVVTELSFSQDFRCRNMTDEGSMDSCATVFAAAADDDLIVQIRKVDITLAGRLGPHRMLLEETVRIRNDRRFRYDSGG